MKPLAWIVPLIIVSLTAWGVIALVSSTHKVAADYTLHLAPTPGVTHGTCAQQLGNWYRRSGQTDIIELASAEQAVLAVGAQGVNAGLPHASRLLSDAAVTAGHDPMPVCADKARAWPDMTGAYTQAATDWYLQDVTDATTETAQATADLRIIHAELPAAWFVKVRPYPTITPPVQASTSTSKAASSTSGSTTVVQAPVVPAASSGAAVQSSTAGPPDTSCSPLGATGVYYTPARGTRDLLQCQSHTTASGTRIEWRITGH